MIIFCSLCVGTSSLDAAFTCLGLTSFVLVFRSNKRLSVVLVILVLSFLRGSFVLEVCRGAFSFCFAHSFLVVTSRFGK